MPFLLVFEILFLLNVYYMLLLQEIEFGRIQFLGQTAGFCSTWNIEIRDKTMGIKMF